MIKLNRNKFEIIFPHNHLNDLICDRLKEIKQLKETIKLKNLIYKTKNGKRYNFSKFSLPITFSRDILKRHNVLSIENAENEQNNLFKELSNLNKVGKGIEKIPFIDKGKCSL